MTVLVEMPGRAGHDVYRLRCPVKPGMTVWLRCPVKPGMTFIVYSGMTGSVVLDVDVEFRVWELDVVLR